MTKYIDVGKAIKAIVDMPNCYNGFSDTYDKACIIGVLEELPPADVAEVHHGRWIYGKRMSFDGTFHWFRQCSECLYEREDDNEDRDTPYCPNCGASMVNEDE